MIGDKDLALPAKMLDLLATNHKLIAHNIANANVQGYRPLEASFGQELAQAIASGDTEAIESVSLTVERAREASVDSEKEMAGMAKNELLFNTFSEIAAFRLRMLRTAITSK